MHPGSRADRLAVALDEFVRSSPDVEAAAVVSFDGLPMASALPEELEEDRLGAMSAALLSLGEQAAAGLGRGVLNQIFVEGEHGYVFLMSARDQAVLTAIANRDAKIGFMLFEMRRAADRIGGALQGDEPQGVIAPEAEPADLPPPAAFAHHLPPPDADQRREVAPELVSTSHDDGSHREDESFQADLGSHHEDTAPSHEDGPSLEETGSRDEGRRPAYGSPDAPGDSQDGPGDAGYAPTTAPFVAAPPADVPSWSAELSDPADVWTQLHDGAVHHLPPRPAASE